MKKIKISKKSKKFLGIFLLIIFLGFMAFTLILTSKLFSLATQIQLLKQQHQDTLDYYQSNYNECIQHLSECESFIDFKNLCGNKLK